MKRLHKVFFLFIIVSMLFSIYSNRINEARLIKLAETQGYGYKYANLDELKSFIQSFNETSPMQYVQVPEFFGVSSQQVIHALQTAGFNIRAEWRKVIEVLDQTSQEQALEKKQIPEIFWEKQKEFISKLYEVFEKFLGMDNPFLLTDEQDAQLKKLLDLSRDDKLMVRSTGKEDTRIITNAGGNESISNVVPTMTAVIVAASKVVTSYFGEKSLNQRLGLGDKTIFDEDIFCPFIVQRMIGEHDEIPSCGVMFTEEAEGGISYKNELDEQGRVKTTGITLIQVAYGHNEGVVNSKVVVDSYVSHSVAGRLVFYPIIRAKHKRLVPNQDQAPGQSSLLVVDNPAEKINQPALSYESLMTLKHFADALEEHYGYPMDVEFVVRDNIIWIVQVRPIVHREERKDRQPVYFSDLESLKGSLFAGRTIGAFGGALVNVNSSDECIMNSRIGGALDVYLKSKRDYIKCIFSGSDAPVTSHEATTFRSEGKPVLYVYDLEGLCHAGFDSAEKKIIFSPQQHCAAVIDRAVEPAIKIGWISYPLPREVSTHTLIDYAKKRGWVKGQLIEQDAPKNVIFAPKEILALLKNEENSAMAQATARILPAVFKEFLERSMAGVVIDADLQDQMTQLINAVEILCGYISELCRPEVPLLVRLVPINFLEALFYQQPFDKVLGYYSVATLQKVARTERVPEQLGGSEQAQTFYVQLKKATNFCYSERVQQAWEKLIRELGGARGAAEMWIKELSNVVKQLAELKIFPLWLNTAMVNDIEQLGNTSSFAAYVECVARWQKTLEQSKDDFSFIKDLYKDVLAFDNNRFADPQKFNAAWREFNETLLNKFMSDGFKGMITQAIENAITNKKVSLVGAAACSLMDLFIDVFDTGIKAMKGSNLWKKNEKIITFKMMLLKYRDLLARCVEQGPIRDLVIPKSEGDKIKINAYFDLLDNLLSKNFTKKDLEPTEGIDVTSFAVGGVRKWMLIHGLHDHPKSGEDAYTIIHQSLLHCNAALMVLCVTDYLVIPEIFKEYVAILKQAIITGGYDFKQVGLFIDDNKVEIIYNLPLGYHGCRINIKKQARHKTLSIEFNFTGGLPFEAYRWKNAAVLFVLCGTLNSFVVEIRNLHLYGFHVTLKNPKIEVWALLLKDIFSAIQASADNVLNLKNVIKGKIPVDIMKKSIVQLRNINFGDFLDDVIESVEAYFEVVILKELESFISFVSDGQRFDEALKVACEVVQYDNPIIRNKGLVLLQVLVEQKQGFNEALKAASEAIVSGKPDLHIAGLDLLQALVEQKKGFDEAAEAAYVAVTNHELDVYTAGLDLFKALVKQGQQFAEARKVACEAVESREPDVWKAGLDLFNNLIHQSKAFDEAINAAGQAVESDIQRVCNAGVALLKSLFTVESTTDQTIKIAIAAIKAPEEEIQIKGLESLKIHFDQIIDEILIKDILSQIKILIDKVEDVEILDNIIILLQTAQKYLNDENIPFDKKCFSFEPYQILVNFKYKFTIEAEKSMINYFKKSQDHQDARIRSYALEVINTFPDYLREKINQSV